MTPEYKEALRLKLVDTDYSQLPDVVNCLTGDSQSNLLTYRTLIRNEMLEITTHFTIDSIPNPPTAVWT